MERTDEVARVLSANEGYLMPSRALEGPRPGRRLALVTCMDARIDVFAAFGLEIGDAHVLRNAGGIVTDDVVRSLCLSQRHLGTREVIVAQHTDCGLQGVSDERLASDIEAATGQSPDWRFGGFDDVEASVRESLRRLRSSPFLSERGRLSGFVFVTASGRLRSVEPA